MCLVFRDMHMLICQLETVLAHNNVRQLKGSKKKNHSVSTTYAEKEFDGTMQGRCLI